MKQNNLIITLLLSWLVSGCATTTPSDPFEKFNRGVFAINDGIDKIMIKPIAVFYKAVVPTRVNKGVTNFFSNLDDVFVVANDVFQFKFKQASSDTVRFLLNSSAGVLGLFDVATKMGFEKHYEDFGQTLGYWGIGSGPYIVLPIFGPSSVRDTIGWAGDIVLRPDYYYGKSKDEQARYILLTSTGVEFLDERARLLQFEAVLKTAALDKYSYIRDAYLARRKYLVYDGKPPAEETVFEEDDIFEDEDEEEEEEEDISE
jgi:phospholipid-binding lipoprotein MlaA